MSSLSKVRARFGESRRMAVTARPIPPPIPTASRTRAIGWPLLAATGSLAAVFAMLLAGTVWILAGSARSGAPNAARGTPTNQIESSPVEQTVRAFGKENAIEASAAPPAKDAANLAEHGMAIVGPLVEPRDTEKQLATIAQPKPPAHNEIRTETVSVADCNNFGTSVPFLPDPTQAARQAAMERKLVFVLHISGNFEDDRFT